MICNSLQKKLGFFLMLISTVLICVVSYMAWWPFTKVVDLKSIEIVNEKGEEISTIKSGEIILYRLKLRKYMKLPSEIHIQILNRINISYPVYPSNIVPTDEMKLKDKNYWDIVYARLYFPETAFGGEHRLYMMLVYKVNMFRTERYSIYTKPFNIIKTNGEESVKEFPPLVVYKK